MIVVHGNTLWSPAPQPMDDDDDDDGRNGFSIFIAKKSVILLTISAQKIARFFFLCKD